MDLRTRKLLFEQDTTLPWGTNEGNLQAYSITQVMRMLFGSLLSTFESSFIQRGWIVLCPRCTVAAHHANARDAFHFSRGSNGNSGRSCSVPIRLSKCSRTFCTYTYVRVAAPCYYYRYEDI
jgi:hypothetical protein